MRPLTITLPPDVFALVECGEKRMIATRRNPRKDRNLQVIGHGFLPHFAQVAKFGPFQCPQPHCQS
jgi:hypothetical protein